MSKFFNTSSSVCFHTLIVSLLALNMMSCSQGSSDSKPFVDQSGGRSSEAQRKASCEFGANEGSAADMSLRLSNRPVTVAFGKVFNRNQLDAILTASFNETLRFVELSGVEVRAVDDSGGCALFANQKRPDGDLQKKWAQATKNDSKETGSILAIYLPKDPVLEAVESFRSKAHIISRESNERYVLIHEFMHHLFSEEAAKNNQLESTIKNNFSKKADDYDQAIEDFNINQSEANQQKVVSSLAEITRAHDVLLVSYTLEEMTIEDILRSEVKNNKLRFVSKWGPGNGALYIESSEESALKRLDLFSNEINKVIRVLKRNANYSAQIDLLLNLKREFIDNRKLEMARIRARNSTSDLLSMQLAMQSPSSPIGLSAHAHGSGCSHSHEAEQLMDQVFKK